ncbi:hypothetical protein FRC04_004840 [Tulasnella sp. 424]|nr:hypothetical protein FRC04_004840 [Tulasnella sp. 424]
MSKMWNKRPSDRPAMMEVVEYAPAPEMPNIAPLKQEGPGSDLPPELEGNLEMIRHDVGRGGTSTVSQSKWHKPLSNGNILTILVAVKVMRISDQQRHRMKQNGDLHSVLAEHPDMDFTKRMDFALQVGKGLQYLHALTPPICHGDLKPRNVLINTEFKALIGDFGLSRIISEVETPPVLAPGLDGYAAPEIWLGDVPSLMTDVYAYGALALKLEKDIHTMVLQQPPLEEFTDSLTTIQPVPPNRGVDSLVPPSIAYLLSTTGDTTSQNMEISEQEPGQGVVDTADPLSTFDFAVGPTSNTSNLPAFNMDDSATLSAGQSDPGTSGEGQVLLLPPPLPGTLTITVKKDGGQFADVYVGEWENTDGKKTVVAIKDIRCTDGAAEKRFQMRISREADIWKAVKHTNILQFIGYVVVEGISGLKLVSPWCQHGNLTSYITNNPELTRAQKIELLCGAARGLEHLHSRTPLIVHGDIKPANVVIQDNREAALCDFGLSRIILDLGKPSGLTTTGNRFGGTAGYQAKELLEGNTATPAVDVYAFGGLILAAMSGRNPLWNRKNDAARIVATCMDQLPVPKEHPGLPADDPLWGLLRECWRGEATERPTIDIVLQMLEGEKDPGDAEAKTPVPSVPSLPQPDTPGGNQS